MNIDNRTQAENEAGLSLIPTTAEGFLEQGFARFDGLLDQGEWSLLSDIYDDIFSAPEEHPNFTQLGGTDDHGQQLMPQILAPHKTHPQLLETQYAIRALRLAQSLLGPSAKLAASHMGFLNQPAAAVTHHGIKISPIIRQIIYLRK